MDYSVWTRCEHWNGGQVSPVGGWAVSDGGLDLPGALTAAFSRSLSHNLVEGERTLEAYLRGDLDASRPFLVRDEPSGQYLWVCVLPDGEKP